jgi:iron complex transport system substrate-binding protein
VKYAANILIMKNHQYIRFLVILTVMVLTISACYNPFIKQSINNYTINSESNCRIIKHQQGETCVPLNPQRLVILDEETLEAVLALGLKPVATAEANWVASKQQIFLTKSAGIISLGKSANPNLERMVKLHPDLILGMHSDAEQYLLFSQIAPTVMFDFGDIAWKQTFLSIGNVINKNQQAQDILKQYEKRVEQVKKVVRQQFKTKKVTVSRFYAAGQETEFRTPYSFPVHVLLELGFSLPQKQLELTQKNLPRVGVTIESVEMLDASALFIALDPGSEINFIKYQKSPLWKKLNVVKNSQVYIVNSSYWIFGNILSANAIIDDIYKYVVDK